MNKNERATFVIILATFIVGLLFFLFVSFFEGSGTAVGRQTWVPRTADLEGSLLFGNRSAAPSELVAVEPVREDVLLPPASSFFDTGFRPQPDGFGFQNYGTRYPEGDLTIDEIRALFGDAVCISVEGDKCVPLPAAHMWIDTMNSYMAAGHCAGFTILSYRFFDQQFTQADFTPRADVTYVVDQRIPVMRQIARDWVLQVTEEVWQARVDGTPRDVVDALLELQEPVDLGIFGRTGGGHSLLAYAISDQGDGIFHIHVYDNNWPGEELYVEVDYRANTWRYSLAAENPTEDAAAWEGDARTNTLIFLPFDAYDQSVTCPFCQDEDGIANEYTYVTTSGDDVLLQAENSDGERVGHYEEDGFVEEVAGARLIRLKDALFNDLEPYLGLPQQESFTLRLKPRPEKRRAVTTLWGGGADFAFALEGLEIQAGEQDELDILPGQKTVIYRPGGPRRPVLKLSLTQNSIPYLFTLSGATFAAEQTLNLGIDPATGQLTISGEGIENLNFTLSIAQITSSGPAIFAQTNLTISENGSTSLNFADWNGEGTIQIAIDTDGDGTPDQITESESVPLVDILEALGSSTEIIQVLDELAPYLTPEEVGEFLETMAAMGLPGEDQGEVLFDFQEFEMEVEDYADYIGPQELPPTEIADFIFELNLPESQINELIALLDLSPEVEQAILEHIALLEQVDGVIQQLEFINVEGAEAVEFISSQGLTPEQIEELIEEIGNTLIDISVEEAAPLLFTPTPTATPIATNTPIATATAEATSTPLPSPTATQTRIPTGTPVPTSTPVPTNPPPPPPPPPTATNTPPNNAPIANNDILIVPQNVATTLDVLSNDSDPDGNTLTIIAVGIPNNGTVSISNNAIVYTPNNDFRGDDTFAYTISDGLLSASATIRVTVNGAPVAVNDTVTVPQDVTTAVNVLANDSDPDGHLLVLTTVTTPANGQVTITNNQISYTPNAGYLGADSFTYTVRDDFETVTASVAITVNGAPLGAADSATTSQGVAILIDVLSNDSDPEGDPLTIRAINPAANGTLVIVGTQIRYTPNSTFAGTDNFSYALSDGYQQVNVPVTITVTNVNDPPQAVDDNAGTDEDVAVVIPVLNNDIDPDGDPLTITAAGPAANGAVAISGATITYTPNANFNGVDSFSYTISDGQASASATVTVFVNAINDDPPVANNDSGTTTLNTSVNIEVLANDFDPDNDAISISAVGTAANGSTSFLPGGSTVLYVPNAGFTGTDTFTYT
ncbi:MAG: tandem-95 repeat protein, partial [Anaerolineales bacterium]|nr:tandem-95 repeat protein [Anaerolineales bacterium]